MLTKENKHKAEEIIAHILKNNEYPTHIKYNNKKSPKNNTPKKKLDHLHILWPQYKNHHPNLPKHQYENSVQNEQYIKTSPKNKKKNDRQV
jgi:hypothetical protein